VSRLQEIVAKQAKGGCKDDSDALLDEEAKIQSMDYCCRQTKKLNSRQI
jgi:hypothetical protein